MTTISLLAKQDHLAKVAATRDPVKALSEFVWNAVDADATNVAIAFATNALGGVEAIHIVDNGHGISRRRAEAAFGQLGDSWKKDVGRTPGLGRAMHGKEGRGRLRFFPWRSARCGPRPIVILTEWLEASQLPSRPVHSTGAMSKAGQPPRSRELKSNCEA